MRSRMVLITAMFVLSTHPAFASSSVDYAGGDSSSSGFSWGGSGGLLAAGGATGLVAGLFSAFHGGSDGARVVTSSPAEAPEISTSGSAAGFALMLGGTLVARGRRRA